MKFSRLVLQWLAVACLLVVSAQAIASEPDWDAIAELDTVHVVTTDSDGGERSTKIWVAVLDGVGYIRTSQGSTWGDNVAKVPEIALHVAGKDYPLNASFIEEPAERERIIAAFEAKYGSNPLLNLIRGSDPRIMRLAPR
jgi:hypothetical protein